MNETQLIQGRLISPQDIEQIRALMIENPKWHRTRLSIEICISEPVSFHKKNSPTLALAPPISSTFFYIYIAIEIKSGLAPPHSRLAQGAHLHSKAVHARSNVPARYRCHSKSSAPQILSLRFNWWAVPTLRACGWLRYGLRMRSYQGGHRPPNRKKMSKPQWWAVPTLQLASRL
jgi:hypothetical protein